MTNHQPAPGEGISLAVISDTHFWPGATICFGAEQEQLQPWSERIHRTLLREVRGIEPDILLHLGDFSCGGGVFDMPVDQFRQTIVDMDRDYRNLAADYYALPGNHDCPMGALDYSFAEKLFGLPSRQGRTVDVDGARLVLLNAQGHSPQQMRAALPNDPTYGWVSDPELERLEHALASAGQAPVLVFTHQLLRPWSNPHPWNDVYAIRNGDAVLEIMARYGNVRAVFQGHAHILDAQVGQVGDAPVHFFVTPALIQYPLGWFLLHLRPRALDVQFCTLPLPDLAARSLAADPASGWRFNPEAAQPLTLPLG